MKIRTALYGASAVPLGLAAIVVLILVVSVRQVEQARARADLIDSLIQGVSDLNMSTCECLQYSRPDSQTQWQRKQAGVTELLGQIVTQSEEERELLDSIDQDHKTMGSLFARLDASGPVVTRGAKEGRRGELQAQLFSQLLHTSHRIISTAQVLGQRSHAEVASAQTTACRRAISTLILVSVLFLGTLVLLAQRIGGPLASLHRAVEIAGQGNLDVRLQAGYSDEIGQVCRSFNNMVANLQESRSTLEGEIAARQQAEEALRASEEQLRKAHDELEARIRERTAAMEQERYLLHTLMDNLPHNIYFKDTASRFIRINKAMATFFGLQDASEAIGKNDYDYFTDEHARQALADERDILQTGQPVVDKEEKETWPDGHCNWALTTKMPLRDEAGRIVGTFGLSRDITERKQVAEALRVAKEAAEAASRAKSVFLANMSHEIRTPLNAIIGMSELVLDTSLSLRQRDFLLAVRDSGEALLSVINDILDFSKIEAGKLVLDRATFDLRDSLGDTMKSFAIRAHKQGLELACQIHPEVPHFVTGDYNRLRQIVVNLVGNAVKFTDGGEVVLAVEPQSRSEHDVVLHFTVSDTGIGVPKDKQAAIFEMFEQADSTMTRRHGGTGLGLAIVSRLVELMDGRIWVESEPGCGSRFHFTTRLGLAEEDAATAEPAEPPLIQGLPVLVVDDNATNRRILEEVLRNWRMVPTLASGASEGMKLMQQAQQAGTPFRLVLTDAHMPETDGFTLAGQIKQDAAMGSTVVMMLTSGSHDDDIARCEELGIAAYLLKPIKQSELLDAIKLAIGITAPEEEASAALAQNPARVGPLRVLLAEDSLVNQKLAVALLEMHGHRVTVANHGREALAAMESEDFDLVLMDVQMPELDGLETTATIRAKERQTGAHVPILAMTAHALKGDRERCLAAGMDGYIAKPIHAKELFELIESMLAGREVMGTGAPPEVVSQTVPAVEPPPDARGPSPEPPADAMHWEGIVDWAEALDAVRGDPHLLRVIVETALEEVPHLMAAIRRSVADGDAVKLRLHAHTLKGSLRYFGPIPAFDEVFRLERMAQAGDLTDANRCLAVLEIDVTSTLQALQNYRERNL